jgi:hypothetical protein
MTLPISTATLTSFSFIPPSPELKLIAFHFSCCHLVWRCVRSAGLAKRSGPAFKCSGQSGSNVSL